MGKRKAEIDGGAGAPPLRLRKELCRACTHCIRVCPTEAIRVRAGKAEIMPHRCIYCGECLRVCPSEAWTACGGSISRLERRNEEAWAVLDLAVFGQFGRTASPDRIAAAFGEVGFAAARDMAEGTESYRRAVAAFLACGDAALPAISSDCPAVVDLIRVKFPSLLENLVPIVPPYEITAERLKASLPAGSPRGLYYIVPCPAKIRAAGNPLSPGGGYSGAIPIADVYNPLKTRLHSSPESGPGTGRFQGSGLNLGWSFTGGETRALGMEATLVVDGIHNVAKVMELAENGLLADVPFIEAWSCSGGCLGGPFNVHNPFWARFYMLSLMRGKTSESAAIPCGEKAGEESRYRLLRPFQAREGIRLDPDLRVAMEKLRRIDEVAKKLPGVDCGSCGCPNCLALAEDVVQGYASEKDCIYKPNGMGRTPQKERKGFGDGDDERQE